jgi:DNA-binding NtrC family response regulator
MPALRDRREDIFTLAVHFLDQCVQKLGKSVNRISNETVELLVYYDWPGNIRELENCIERSVVMAEGDTIQPNDLPPELRQNRPHRSSSARSAIGQVGAAFTRGSSGIATRTRTIVDRNKSTGEKKRVEPPPETLDAIEQEAFEFERVQLLDALREAGGNRSQAARLLGLPRTTMLSRMKRHGLM